MTGYTVILILLAALDGTWSPEMTSWMHLMAFLVLIVGIIDFVLHMENPASRNKE